ncbi:MAG TPA: SCO family protein [Pseudobdellovibrionaceae bacterium]|nr:SCO family protein [Pseudobdellovibrionaceae bacterium]
MKFSKEAPYLMMAIWILGTLFWWGLAFYPTGEQTPEWLNVARNVCFGALNGGLPDPAGWIVLALGPLSFLVVGFVAWPGELRKALRNLSSTGLGKSLAVLLLIAVGVEANWVRTKFATASLYESFSYKNPSPEDLPLGYLRTNRPAPDFTLVDQSGSSFRLADHSQDTILLTFAFAHCESVCPVLVRQVLDVAKTFKGGVRVVVLTLDPWRDTPKSLPSLAREWEFPEKSHLLSGPVEDVTAVLKSFQVSYQRNEKNGDIVHPALVYVIAPGGQIAYTFNNAPDQWLRQAIERIANDGRTHSASR